MINKRGGVTSYSNRTVFEDKGFEQSSLYFFYLGKKYF